MSDIELESTIYDEFSRLNNELVAMQRELAKKNAELERLNRENNYFLRIVEGHGGAVKVESRLGRGCTFTVRIPLEARH